MKKTELKALIKPIVEECVKDALLHNGLLSKVISEVVTGLQGSMISEKKSPEEPRRTQQEASNATKIEREKVMENKKNLLNAIGEAGYNGIDVFEGTQPLKRAGKPSSNGSGGYSPFEGVDPADPGVDISKLASSKNWKRLAEGNK